MRVDCGSGRVPQARWCPSPNRDYRPKGAWIDAIVVHGISLPPGEFGGDAIERLFTNRLDTTAHPFYRELVGVRLSSHLLLRRDGELVQFVALGERAWHAGHSRLGDRLACNDFSIGIELEGTDDIPYAEAQYQALIPLLQGLMRAYPRIAAERIVGHCHVAPDRKTDPGPAFDWERLRRALALPPALKAP